MTPPKPAKKTLRLSMNNYTFKQLDLWFHYLFLAAICLILSACSPFVNQNDKDLRHTYKVIMPGASEHDVAIIEGTHITTRSKANVPNGGVAERKYANIIAVDDTKVGEYKISELSANMASTRNYLKNAISSYKTEVSVGEHSLLALRVDDCYVAEIKFTVEANKKYLIMPYTTFGKLPGIIIKDIKTNKNTSFNESLSVNGGSFLLPVSCEKLEEYRNDFIARHKQVME